MIRIGYISTNQNRAEKLGELLGSNYVIETIESVTFNSSSPSSILALIRLCDVIVADVGKGSNNVFYEIGLAHGQGKPVIIVTNSKNELPANLRGQKCFRYTDTHEGLKNLVFSIKEIIKSEDTLLGLRGPIDRFDLPVFSNQTNTLSVRELFKYEGVRKFYALKQWFTNMASNIPGWSVVEPGKNDPGMFDLLIWNSINDFDIRTLGNPIAVEFKSALNKDQACQIIDMTLKSGVKSLLFITLGKNSSTYYKFISKIQSETGAVIVLLNRDDLIDITSPESLLKLIKVKILHGHYEEDGNV
ncbi:hypothetical protein JI666_11545 [Bacillus sp. NTK071]|uniref:hypothetical protein n=1 Tax=Bacillus sp. NTK071 TaxID=2802175 RepID=UPI001A8D37AE|nr:hypothetical protein [Bacillus sp. NTK071]MBN8209380.1 hypothetical protein [Bacillus sp. NTK071]